ncbi:MAG: phosphate/phosphite/phosphonate ABC transporter substrate-binding protein, partial [Frankiales bacterium]|nr:phosphate/phosphite/phosphonate ABC transporter substrate-binding protein [Frankiales bacterium]
MHTPVRNIALISAAALTLFTSACGGSSSASVAADPAACPNGKVRFGIEPYEDPSKLTPA